MSGQRCWRHSPSILQRVVKAAAVVDSAAVAQKAAAVVDLVAANRADLECLADQTQSSQPLTPMAMVNFLLKKLIWQLSH